MKKLILSLMMLPMWASAQNYITTYAGNGSGISSGDGGSCLSASFAIPTSMCIDSDGNTYIGEAYAYKIRKITPDGIISTLAGTGISGYSGDGGLAIAAKMNMPIDLKLDGLGNLYFSDFSNHCIRKINLSTGIITTVAGNGTPGYSGDGGPATSATILNAGGLCFDPSGNLVFSDYSNSRIRKVDISTGIISTIVGTGTAGYSGDGGPATSANIYEVWTMQYDPSGNLFFCDASNDVVRKVDVSGNISTVAGNHISGASGMGGAATAASLNNPAGLALDPLGNIYIADQFNYSLRKVDASGIITNFAGNGTSGFSGDGGDATTARISNTNIVQVDPAGDILFTDNFNNRVRVVYVNDYDTFYFKVYNDTVNVGDTGNYKIPYGVGLTYQWQKKNATGVFVDISDAGVYHGTSTRHLQVYPAATSLNGETYRCLVNKPSGHTYATNEGKLIVIGGSSGIANYSVIHASLFPNPAKDAIYLEWSNAESSLDITIYNATGAVAVNIPKYEQGQAIDIRNLSTGVYYIKSSVFGTQVLHFVKD